MAWQEIYLGLNFTKQFYISHKTWPYFLSNQATEHIFHAANGLPYFCIILETRMSFFKQAPPFVIPYWILPNYLFLKKNHSHKQDVANGISMRTPYFFSFYTLIQNSGNGIFRNRIFPTNIRTDTNELLPRGSNECTSCQCSIKWLTHPIKCF